MTDFNVSVLYLARPTEEPYVEAFFATLAAAPPGYPAAWGFLHKPGIAETLVARWYREVAGIASGTWDLPVPTGGYCTGAYGHGIRHVDTEIPVPHRVLVFMKASSRPLHADWLRRLVEPFADPRVAIVGATGSHERTRYAPFPNPHIRTTAFAVRRSAIGGFRWPFPSSPGIDPVLGLPHAKLESDDFAGGPQGLTRTLLANGYEGRVVGQDGRVVDIRDRLALVASHTFRAGNQENLIVAEQRTDDYRDASPLERGRLASYAWGSDAEPELER